MSRNRPQTSTSLSNDWYISCVIDKSWFMQESLGLKPDWFGKDRLLAGKYSNILL